MQDFVKMRYFWLMLCMGLVMPLCMPAFAQEDEEEEGEDEAEEAVDPDAWKKERAELVKKINAEVKKRTSAIVTHQKIVGFIDANAGAYEKGIVKMLTNERGNFYAREVQAWKKKGLPRYPNLSIVPYEVHAWVYPIAVSKLDTAKIKAELEAFLQAKFRGAYPEESEKALYGRGREKYKMIEVVEGKPNPLVKFKLRGGKGIYTEVEGRLLQVTGERLRVSTRWINRVDLDDETSALFYKEVNDRFVKEYVEQEQRKYKALLESFVSDWTSYLLPDRLMKENYIPVNYLIPNIKTRRPDTVLRRSPNLKNWTTRKEFEQKIYKTAYDLEKGKQQKKVEQEFYTKATEHECSENYEYVKEAKEWMPNSVAVAYREQKQAEAEAAKAARQGAGGPDGMGGPGMGSEPGMAPGPGEPPR